MSIKKQNLDPRVKRSRQFLRDALISLIAEKGFDATTVQDITQKADLNRATFYLHYRDKNDLLAQSIEEMLNQLVEALGPPSVCNENGQVNKDKPYPVFVVLFEHIEKHATFYRVMLAKRDLPIFTTRLLEVLKESFSQALSKIHPNDQHMLVPRDILLSYVTTALFGVVVYWLKNDMPYTPRYMATKLTQLYTLNLNNSIGLHRSPKSILQL